MGLIIFNDRDNGNKLSEFMVGLEGSQSGSKDGDQGTTKTKKFFCFLVYTNTVIM